MNSRFLADVCFDFIVSFPRIRLIMSFLRFVPSCRGHNNYRAAFAEKQGEKHKGEKHKGCIKPLAFFLSAAGLPAVIFYYTGKPVPKVSLYSVPSGNQGKLLGQVIC